MHIFLSGSGCNNRHDVKRMGGVEYDCNVTRDNKTVINNVFEEDDHLLIWSCDLDCVSCRHQSQSACYLSTTQQIKLRLIACSDMSNLMQLLS